MAVGIAARLRIAMASGGVARRLGREKLAPNQHRDDADHASRSKDEPPDTGFHRAWSLSEFLARGRAAKRRGGGQNEKGGISHGLPPTHLPDHSPQMIVSVATWRGRGRTKYNG